MRIGIDISQVVYGTGVSNYTKNLLRNLLSIDKENEYILFAGSLRRKKDVLRIFPQSKIFPIPPTLADLLWNKLHVFPIENLIGKIDVFHSSDWSEPPSKAFKVTTIHDLAPVLYPDLFPKDIIRNILDVHKHKLSWVQKESSRIIVPSQATMNDLLRIGFDQERIRVIPEAPTSDFMKVADEKVRQLKKKYNISGNYLLAVGINPRKNTKRIIKAFDLIRAGRDLKLVIIGQAKYKNFEENRNIRLTGEIPDEELPVFYSGAEALVYPSLYEGFGIPILDAFACKTPVVTSNISSMPEVAGDAAELVDPTSVDSIAEGIKKVIRGPKYYIEKGEKQVKKFSWGETAKKTLDVYMEARQ